MASIGGLLFGDKPTPQVTTSNSTSSMPQWLQEFYQGLLTKGSQAAEAPYVANPNQQVAPLTDYQNQAYQSVANMQGAQQPLLNSAAGFAQQAGSPFDANQLQTYMSPYTQNVVNTIGTLAGRNLSENLLPKVNDTFTRSGQFGSRGNFDLTARAIRDANESALNQQAQALESGYGTALGAYQADQARKLGAAGTLGDLATTGQNIGLQGAAALEAAGQSQQTQGQKNLDVLNQEWLKQQNYPKEQVSWLNTLFNPAAGGTSTTTTSSTTPSNNGSSPLGGIIGAIGGIGSLIGSLFKEGGKVDKEAEEEWQYLENDPMQNQMLVNDPDAPSADWMLDYYYENGYWPGENPNAHQWPGGLKPVDIPGFAEGGMVDDEGWLDPALAGSIGQRAHENYNTERTNEAFADAFADWGAANMRQTPEQKILELVTRFGLSEEEAADLVYREAEQAAAAPIRKADGGSIGGMGPDRDSITRGNAEIIRRAKVALAKPQEERDDRDRHALRMYRLLMDRDGTAGAGGSGNIVSSWQDEDGNTYSGQMTEREAQNQNLKRRDAMTPPNHRKPVPGAVGYRGGGSIGSLGRAA